MSDNEHLREDEQAMLLRCDSIQKQFDGAEVRMLLSRLSEARAQLQVEQDNCGRLLAKLAAAESREAKLRRELLKVEYDQSLDGENWCSECDYKQGQGHSPLCEKGAALSPEIKPEEEQGNG